MLSNRRAELRELEMAVRDAVMRRGAACIVDLNMMMCCGPIQWLDECGGGQRKGVVVIEVAISLWCFVSVLASFHHPFLRGRVEILGPCHHF